MIGHASTEEPLRYVVQIDVAPYQSEIVDLAFYFCKTLLEVGEVLDLVFFYGDGVYHALESDPPQGEEDKTGRWRILAAQHGVPLVICSSSAQRRGVRVVPKRDVFQVAGLARLAEAILRADRYLRFSSP